MKTIHKGLFQYPWKRRMLPYRNLCCKQNYSDAKNRINISEVNIQLRKIICKETPRKVQICENKNKNKKLCSQ